MFWRVEVRVPVLSGASTFPAVVIASHKGTGEPSLGPFYYGLFKPSVINPGHFLLL